MGRFARSLALAKESFAILRSNPQLAWFPVVSAIFTLGVTASFFIPLFVSSGGFEHIDKNNGLPPLYYAVLFLFYLTSYFIVIFFNVGLVSCAHASLRGDRMSFSEGIQAAFRHLPAILGWALVSATVGMILRVISERVGIIGKIVVALIGGAWNLITYFVVPVIAIEQGGPISAIKKSSAMLKSTWGENVIGNAGISLVFGLLSLLPVVPIIAVCMTGSVTLIVIAIGVSVLYWLVLATISASLTGIYCTALYLYADSGTTPPGYQAEHLQSAFRQGKPNMVSRFKSRF